MSTAAPNDDRPDAAAQEATSDAGADPSGHGAASATIPTLSVPEVAAALGLRDREVRGMLSERSLLATRRTGAGPAIPAAFLVPVAGGGSQVLPGLRGTVTQLGDAGFADAEIIDWLFRPNAELGSTPLEALTALRTHAVRRAAQALAF